MEGPQSNLLWTTVCLGELKYFNCSSFCHGPLGTPSRTPGVPEPVLYCMLFLYRQTCASSNFRPFSCFIDPTAILSLSWYQCSTVSTEAAPQTAHIFHCPCVLGNLKPATMLRIIVGRESGVGKREGRGRLFSNSILLDVYCTSQHLPAYPLLYCRYIKHKSAIAHCNAPLSKTLALTLVSDQYGFLF